MADVRPPPAPPPWARSLFTVGVTGTNGKTSTTATIAALLTNLERPVARVTTVGSFLDDERLDVPAHYEGFLETMRRCVAAGGRYAAVEFTSEALALGFARAWPCRIAVFTNLSQDHADAHASMEQYLACKAQLFMALEPGGVAVLNARDAAAKLLAEVVPPGVELLRYGVPARGDSWATADLAAHSLHPSFHGTTFELERSLRFPGLPRTMHIRAIGEVFVENALAALGAALAAGVPMAGAVGTLSQVPPPFGRFQLVHERPNVVIDYAHTPDALERTLQTARRLCTGRLSVVFGAGGQRDRTKRPLLGSAARIADHVVVTSDNPRNEDPLAIMAEIAEGLDGHGDVLLEVNREHAIQGALCAAGPQDLVLIAGKGHERTQEAWGVLSPFSDESIVRALLEGDDAAGQSPLLPPLPR